MVSLINSLRNSQSGKETNYLTVFCSAAWDLTHYVFFVPADIDDLYDRLYCGTGAELTWRSWRADTSHRPFFFLSFRKRFLVTAPLTSCRWGIISSTVNTCRFKHEKKFKWTLDVLQFKVVFSEVMFNFCWISESFYKCNNQELHITSINHTYTNSAAEGLNQKCAGVCFLNLNLKRLITWW